MSLLFQATSQARPLFPGSLLIEGLAQAGSSLFFKDPEYRGQLPIYSGIINFQFYQPAEPGDQVRLELEVLKKDKNQVTLESRALIDGKVIAEGDLHYTFAEPPSGASIHPTSTVHPSAILGKDVTIGPYSIIGANVIVGDRTRIEGQVLLEPYTQIGQDCHIFFGSVLGSLAQDTKYKGERSGVKIGDRNVIREYVTINRATGEDNFTTLGDDNFLMTHTHLGHNTIVGNNVVFTNSSCIAGHTNIGNKVNIGASAGVHQFVRIGDGAMIGAYTKLTQDVPPFLLGEGNPASVRNVNLVGLKRQGFSKDAIKEIRNLFKVLYRSDQNFTQAINSITDDDMQTDESKFFIDFCKADSDRGLLLKSPS